MGYPVKCVVCDAYFDKDEYGATYDPMSRRYTCPDCNARMRKHTAKYAKEQADKAEQARLEVEKKAKTNRLALLIAAIAFILFGVITALPGLWFVGIPAIAVGIFFLVKRNKIAKPGSKQK